MTPFSVCVCVGGEREGGPAYLLCYLNTYSYGFPFDSFLSLGEFIHPLFMV